MTAWRSRLERQKERPRKWDDNTKMDVRGRRLAITGWINLTQITK